MSSYWPETSRPETSQQSSSYPEDECITQLEAEGAPLPLARLQHPYTPRVNDLVIASPRLLRADRTNIPPSFKQSEAVDSSVLIGHGASFNVTRQAIPRDRDSVIDSLTLGKLVTIKMLSQLQKRPRYVVYKSPRIAFEPNGEPSSSQDRRALESVLTELHALLHHPLRYHANIIDLIGVAWGRNHANLSQQLPALIVEYGDRGTLADVQIGKDALSEQLKSQITLEIASGLQALHEENIVHGDLKPENIIMCSDSENILVPKLADFGFSIIEAAGTLNIMLGGSRTWRAPESYSRLAISMLKFTDIYSFGLVVWSIALDGENPFNTLLPKSLQSETRLLAQDRLKNQDKLRPLLKFEQWLNRWQTLKSAPTCKVCDLETESYALGTDLNDDPSHLLQRCDEYTASITALGQRQKRFYCFLEDVLDCTLSVHHPLERDLGRTIELCENGMVVEVITWVLYIGGEPSETC
jgi:serine/threonine protein kinase